MPEPTTTTTTNATGDALPQENGVLPELTGELLNELAGWSVIPTLYPNDGVIRFDADPFHRPGVLPALVAAARNSISLSRRLGEVERERDEARQEWRNNDALSAANFLVETIRAERDDAMAANASWAENHNQMARAAWESFTNVFNHICPTEEFTAFPDNDTQTIFRAWDSLLASRDALAARVRELAEMLSAVEAQSERVPLGRGWVSVETPPTDPDADYVCLPFGEACVYSQGRWLPRNVWREFGGPVTHYLKLPPLSSPPPTDAGAGADEPGSSAETGEGGEG